MLAITELGIPGWEMNQPPARFEMKRGRDLINLELQMNQELSFAKQWPISRLQTACGA